MGGKLATYSLLLAINLRIRAIFYDRVGVIEQHLEFFSKRFKKCN